MGTMSSRIIGLWRVVCVCAIVALSYLNYIRNYQEPAEFFWDENYHIPSAQKYLDGVHFMELHPPLGKLVIAAGEWLLHPNTNTSAFLRTEYFDSNTTENEDVKKISFAGYRLFPTILGGAIPLLLWCFLILLTGNSWIAVLGASLPLFDNAMIVHLRGAMLEGTQLFFLMSALVVAILARRRDVSPRKTLLLIFFGALFGCAVTTKVTSLIIAPVCLWVVSSRSLKNMFVSLAAIGTGFVIAFLSVWYLHFARMTSIEPSLQDAGYFHASPEYKAIIDKGGRFSLVDMPTLLTDAYRFSFRHEKGVPRLNLCKSKEDGSPALLWPFAGRSIKYLWDTGGEGSRYLYLQANPVVWGLGLLGVIGAIVLVLSSVIQLPAPQLQRRGALVLFLSLYIVYMAFMSRVERVMYMYHYFVPLLLSFILLGLVIGELQRMGGIRLTAARKNVFCALLIPLIAWAFWYYSPLTYYMPITDEELSHRALFRFWDLNCAGCPLTNNYAQPIFSRNAVD